MVKARSQYFPPAVLCEFVPVLGRIPRFQNPVKYICNQQINWGAPLPLAIAAVISCAKSVTYQL